MQPMQSIQPIQSMQSIQPIQSIQSIPSIQSMQSMQSIQPIQPIIIPMSYPLLQTGINQETFNQFYSNSLMSQSNNLQNRKLSIPSLDNFFKQVDSEYGNTGEYLSFKEAFENENITTDMISELTDNEFEKLGVIKIGWRKILRKVAKLYN